MAYNDTIGIANVLLNYLTPQLITYIDVREESSEWLTWLKDKQIKNIHWIESDLIRSQALDKQIRAVDLSIQLKIQTVGEQSGQEAYYRYSISQENGLTTIDQLDGIWKNISERGKEIRDITPLSDVLDRKANQQWLIMDALNGFSVLEKELDGLDKLDLISIRTSLGINSTVFQSFNKKLEKAGFLLLDSYGTYIPEIMRVIYIRNYPQIAHYQSTEYQRLNVEYNALREEVLELKNSESDAIALRSDLDVIQSQLAVSNNENKELLAKLQSATQELSELQERYNIVCDKEVSMNDLVAQSQSIVKALEEQKKNMVTQQLFNKTHINVVAQLENYIALNNYFNTGSKLSNYHGWPISPDIALFIVDVINEKNYDAIIEFGSGTSTELFAKIALMRKKKNQKVPKILSFDHLSEYYEKTQAILSRESLGDFVQLECAPLIPMSLQDDDYQYYDCEHILKVFLADLPIDAKILVLVDGPPGVTCKHARYPALPMIYKVLTQNNQLDFVMDDAARLEEKEVVDKWKVYLDQNEYSYLESIPRVCEKGLVLLSVFRD